MTNEELRMADSEGMIASAVVIPDLVDRSDTPNSSLKRRQSTISESDHSKRPRLSLEPEDDQRSPDLVTSAVTASSNNERRQLSEGLPISGRPRRPSIEDAGSRRKGRDEERQRGRRLFGALLGTLSQSAPASKVQRKRADIEEKQRARLQEEARESDEQQRVRLKELATQRYRRQKEYDKQAMRVRHANMRATANFLQTTTEPSLYYLPWELLPEDKERIDLQKRNLEAEIQRDLDATVDSEEAVEALQKFRANRETRPFDDAIQPKPVDRKEADQVGVVTEDANAEVVDAKVQQTTSDQTSEARTYQINKSSPDASLRGEQGTSSEASGVHAADAADAESTNVSGNVQAGLADLAASPRVEVEIPSEPVTAITGHQPVEDADDGELNGGSGEDPVIY